MRAPEFWYAPPDGPGALARALTPIGWIYGAGTRLRLATGSAARVAVPVVCVGNLVAGGAGKTPVVLSLARRLAARGRAPHLLTRGHGGRAAGPLRVAPARHAFRDVGDEALLLAQAAPTWVARDRASGARAAVTAGAGLVVMDDGLQNPSLAKDLSLLVVDASAGFGNERLIPAGPLREPVDAGLARVQAVVAVHAPAGDGVADLRERVAPRPLLEARLEPTDDARALAGRDVVAFAGIGRPDRFFRSLEAFGCRLRARHPFPDHHAYRGREIEAVRAEARALGALPVTTAKDLVRLDPSARAGIAAFPVAIRWTDEAALDRLLDGIGTPA